ncbi:MAG: hypothetical protein ACOZQL_07375 [Myxococcota bacterium]
MRPLVLLVALASLCAQAQNVLSLRAPARADGVLRADRLTDLQSPIDADAWDGPMAVMLPPGAQVVWDLGAVGPLEGGAIQADNNDEYFIAVSDDGVSWRDWLVFTPADGAGLRTRAVEKRPVQARFVRLTASGGDGRYSVSELELFAHGTSGSTLLSARWLPRRPLALLLLGWAAGLTLLLVIASSRLPRRLSWTFGAFAVLVTGALVFELAPSSPDHLQALPFARAAVALVAIAAVVRERLWRGTWPAHRGLVVGALGVSAAMATWCFLNLGTPQFFDVGRGQRTWLHHYDMRTYYPIAKYFPELRFDGVYAASVLAVAEGRNLDDFDGQPIRDLRTHVLTNVRESKQHLLEVRRRFSPARWQQFLSDMQYFRRAMGDGGFLGSMNDHGGNATPVWFLSARALFAAAPASDATLWTGVIADVLLLALAFFAIGWAWGARTALLALTVFGAMDFYQFGSNWFGATLRHDWLSLWAIGLALLHKRKLELAGAAFAWSAWIRAFPALTFVTLSIPAVWVGGKLLLQHRRAEAWATLKPLMRVALGVLVTSVVLVGLSVLVFGTDSWVEWLRKVQTLDKDNHVNNISFRTYINTAPWAHKAAIVGALAMLVVALRRASPARAAAWGVALVPIVFNPANYYMHSAFLLVTLAGEQRSAVGPRTDLRGALVWLALLVMCVASYFPNVGTDLGNHFRLETLICFATLGALWVLELVRPPEPALSAA